MECRFCSAHCSKKGKRHGSQQFQCTSCHKYQKKAYRYKSYLIDDHQIISHVKEGVGIRSMARLLGISENTVIRRIDKIARSIRKPPIPKGRTFEIDELCTFVGSKNRRCWIVMAFDRDQKQVLDFFVGSRTLGSLRMVVNTVLISEPQQIYTDRLVHYRSLVPVGLHNTKRYGTNHIERLNLSLRIGLKRLSRRTLCFSKTKRMLTNCLLIYFWG